MRYYRIFLLLIAACAVPLSGCGGSGEPTVEDVDPDVIEQEAQELEESYGDDYTGGGDGPR